MIFVRPHRNTAELTKDDLPLPSIRVAISENDIFSFVLEVLQSNDAYKSRSNFAYSNKHTNTQKYVVT